MMTDISATIQRRVIHASVARVRLVPAVILGLLAILLIL
jgi:hypothetical protein